MLCKERCAKHLQVGVYVVLPALLCVKLFLFITNDLAATEVTEKRVQLAGPCAPMFSSAIVVLNQLIFAYTHIATHNIVQVKTVHRNHQSHQEHLLALSINAGGIFVAGISVFPAFIDVHAFPSLWILSESCLAGALIRLPNLHTLFSTQVSAFTVGATRVDPVLVVRGAHVIIAALLLETFLRYRKRATTTVMLALISLQQ